MVDGLGITSDSRILDGLRLLAECVNVLVRKLFKLAEGFLLGCLVEDEVFEELKVLLRQALVGQMGVLGQDICGKVEMLVLAV